MAGGRPAKPVALVSSRNPRSKLIVNEPVQSTMPEMPDYLVGHAKEKWDEYAPILFAARLLTDRDVDALANYCIQYAIMRDCLRALKVRETVTTMTNSGYEQPSPEIAMIGKAQKLMTDIGGQFGLSPSTRSKLGIPSVAEESNEDFFAH